MNHPDFTTLRRQIDEAITFHDLLRARSFINEGLRLAGEMQCPGEAMYFYAQEKIIAEAFEEAVDLLEQALVFNPLDGAAYNDIALCMVEMGSIEGVLEIFDKGLLVEPDYATIHHNKGWFLNKIGRPTEALICFKQALVFEPERVVTWENMANAYEEQGHFPEALGAYRKALSFLNEHSGIIKEQLQVEIARLEEKVYRT